VKRDAIVSGFALRNPTQPLRILGGDPGSATGIVVVEFPQRRSDGSPLWRDARLLGACTVAKSARAGATEAELDILFRRKLTTAIADILAPYPGERPPFGVVDIVALEEPLDGMAGWAGNQPGKVAGPQKRSTPFRIGAAYAMLLAAATIQARPSRAISFTVHNHKGRRGWMKGKRENVLEASHVLLRSIAPYKQVEGLRKLDGSIPDHILMALGVVNFLVENYAEFML
jgi:hypothetical protein